eukprot:m.106614 g.106614  ORF g.106614 m.106614 type:complete len:113 (-) comp19003_c0_seq1:50-388(-)
MGLGVHGVSVRVDDSGASIGKRYARTDEIAIPFGVTVDPETLKDGCATVRDRDSMQQIRVKLEEIPALVSELSAGTRLWADAVQQYGLTVTGSEKDDTEEPTKKEKKKKNKE